MCLYSRRGAFKSSKISMVWDKAKPINGLYESLGIREDVYGSLIKQNEYGNRSSFLGWEVDHINPKKNSGSNHISNLQPLYYRNNLQKSDKSQVQFICEALLATKKGAYK